LVLFGVVSSAEVNYLKDFRADADPQQQINELKAFSNINRNLAMENKNIAMQNKNTITDTMAELGSTKKKLEALANESIHLFEFATDLVGKNPLLDVFAVAMKSYADSLREKQKKIKLL
jgi:hypothetical protein